MHRTIYDTDGYVAAVTPLADEPAIQRAIVARTLAAIDRELDGVPGSSILHRAAEVAATRIVESEPFAQLWERLNREGHAEALTWFSGESSRVSARVDDDQLIVSLAPLVEQVVQRIEGVGVGSFRLSGERIRRLDPKIVLVDGPLVGPVQKLLRTLNDLVVVLPVLTIVAVLGATVAAVDRRRALARLGIGLIIAMAVALIAMRIGRTEFLDWIATTSVSVPASTAFFDTLVRGLRSALLIGLMLGVGVALAARFAGGRSSTAMDPPGSVAAFMIAHVHGASVAVVLLGLGALALIPRPTLVTALFVGLVAIVAIVGLWVLVVRVRAAAR